MRSHRSARTVGAFFIMKRYVLIGGNGKPTESWLNALHEANTYEECEGVYLDLAREELIEWGEILDVMHCEVM